ncbi:hypothetical protein C8034_v008494 [Colletotrichum sidae]|uniref:Uncharacterized protein n=1 Tax=Colletotrichum sidae TaxID=1347389 RepID=A0A4R8TRE7_9PEZI|nr:hypothetical protein C8034_v008494 [Colletotrichum sidae]
MAAFSRGLGLRLSLLPRAPLPSRSVQPLTNRLFTTLQPLRYATRNNFAKPAAAAKPTPKAPSPLPSKPTSPPPNGPSTAPTTYALLLQLAKKQSPTLLYESSSHFWMKLSAWGAALMFYGYAGVNFYLMIYDPPADISPLVSYAFGFICLATAAFGSYFFVGVNNIIRSVRAVPTTTLVAGGKLPADAARASPVHLEIKVKKLVGRAPRTLIVPPNKVTIPYRVFQPQRYISPVADQRKKAAAAKREWEYDQKHLMTVPFRHAGKGMKAAWYGVTRALTKTGFMTVEVDGEKLKLDVHSGWALEDGRVVDRLVNVGSK